MPESSPADPAAEATRAPGAPPLTVLDLVRFLVELFAIFTFAWWGFTTWPFAWNILAGVAAPAIAIVAWALFVSPRAVIPTHPFVRAAVELVVFAATTVAWWTMGQVWIGLAFALVAIVSGLLVGRSRLS